MEYKLISIWNTFGALAAIIVINSLIQRWRTFTVARSRGCKPAPRHRQRDPFFGLDFFVQSMKASLGRRRMEWTRSLFLKHGRTFQVTNFGKEFIFTIEPTNVQSVMALDFESWGLEPLRLPAVDPYIGPGVFTTDGRFWSHARAQVKPILSKGEFSDLSRLEHHFQNLLHLVPRDGSPIDVQPLLEQMVLVHIEIQVKFLLIRL